MERFLDYLSGDNYVEQSVEISDNSDEFINKAFGRAGSWTYKFREIYAKTFENMIISYSKQLFA